MEQLTREQIQGKVLDHLGLVAATLDTLGLIEKVDALLPMNQEKGVKVSMGQRVAAMIYNGLGFIDDRLYLFEQFLANKPVDRLFGEHVKAEYFNDDALGRCLDAIAEYGVTKFFTEISFAIGKEHHLIGKTVHGDTTTLLVYGDYEQEASDPQPKQGWSKAKRPELKQMILQLATTGSSHFPLSMEAHSGNASDQVTLIEAAKRMEHFKNQLDMDHDFLYVGDSSFYTGAVIEETIKWLSRVPETLNLAQVLLEQDESDLNWHTLPNGYQIQSFDRTYKNVQQRWLLVYSPDAFVREEKTLNKNIEKEKQTIEKQLWHLKHEEFKCKSDAHKAVSKLKYKYHAIHYEIETIKKYTQGGRPKANSEDYTPVFKVVGTCLPDEKKIDRIRRSKGRFILATNQLDRHKFTDEEMLSEYKAQSGTERGFQFIKDNAFEVDSIFLKKPSRIHALMSIMCLCLMVYGFAQYQLRTCLQSTGETIPNQVGKKTSQPSMKWIFRLFHGIQVVTIQTAVFTQEIVINLKSITEKIIDYFGHKAKKIYGLAG